MVVVRDSYIILSMTFLIMLPRAISEFLFRRTSFRMVWVFRVIDVFDIILQTISYFALAIYIFVRCIPRDGYREHLICMVLTSLLIGGHMMHFAANALDMHYKEVLYVDTENAMPESAYTLLHFLDEYLSHIILFTSMILLMTLGVISEIGRENGARNLDLLDRILIIFSSLILGVALGLTAVESSIPVYMIVLSVANLGVIIWFYRERARDSISKYPFSLYVVILLTLIVVSDAVYCMLFGTTSPRDLIVGGVMGGA